MQISIVLTFMELELRAVLPTIGTLTVDQAPLYIIPSSRGDEKRWHLVSELSTSEELA